MKLKTPRAGLGSWQCAITWIWHAKLLLILLGGFSFALFPLSAYAHSTDTSQCHNDPTQSKILGSAVYGVENLLQSNNPQFGYLNISIYYCPNIYQSAFASFLYQGSSGTRLMGNCVLTDETASESTTSGCTDGLPSGTRVDTRLMYGPNHTFSASWTNTANGIVCDITPSQQSPICPSSTGVASPGLP